jgi:hypothetical protein
MADGDEGAPIEAARGILAGIGLSLPAWLIAAASMLPALP